MITESCQYKVVFLNERAETENLYSFVLYK